MKLKDTNAIILKQQFTILPFTIKTSFMLHLLINIYFRLSKTCNTYQWLKKISLAVQQLKWGGRGTALACLSFTYGAFRRRKSIEQMPIWLKN